MKGGLRTEQSRLITLQPDMQSVGVLTPVHVEDIVKDRNLDYLQTLGQLVQKMQANPVWYEYESNQNKVKFLQIYQIAINYARNTESIYNGILNQFQQEFEMRKQKVRKLKSEILIHKEKTLKMRKYYRKQKLNREKQKVLTYQRNLKMIRDDMIRQKRELQQKNQSLLTQQRLRQQSQAQKQSYSNSPFQRTFSQQNLAFPPQAYPPFYAYPPYPPPNYQYPPVVPQNPFNNIFQANIPSNVSLDGNKKQNDQLQKRKSGKQQKNTSKNEKTSNNIKISQKNSEIGLTDSFVEQVQQKYAKKKEKKQQLKISQAQSEALRGTEKSYSFKQSNNVRSSVIQSQNNDQVKQLYPNSLQRRKELQSRLSNKSIDILENDLNSIMDIQLKTQSKNDLEDNFKKPLIRQTSIAEQVITNPKSNLKKKGSPDTVQKKQQKPVVKFKQQKIQKKSSIQGNFSIKISRVTEAKSPQADRKSLNLNNYLAQSNQGQGGYQGIFKAPQVRLRQQDKLRVSMANSLDDVSSKYGGSRHGQNYNEFQDEQEVKNTRIKINVDTNSSPQTIRNNQFVPLYKNYFILKQQAKGLQDSNVSGIGSLKQFSVKFIGSERRKTFNQKSIRGISDSDNMQLIDMPQNSVIAKPSKLKQSTIRKSTIQHKIHKSNDQRTNQFQEKTPAKSKLFPRQKQSPRNQNNFQRIKSIQTLKSKIIPTQSKNNFLTVPKKPEENLSLSMTESHILKGDQVIQQQKQSKQSDSQQSLRLSVIPESQNQSLFTHNSNKNRILILIDRKYSQKGTLQFDKNLIRNQIIAVMPKKEEDDQGFSWQELIERFTQMSKKKEAQVAILKEERIKKCKDLKQLLSNKIPSKKYIKNQKTNQIKSNQKIKEQDDLSYSRSMIENVPSQKIKGSNDPSTKITVANHQSMKQNKSTSQVAKSPRTTTQSKMGQSKQSKFIRQQKETNVSKYRQINKIIQKNKFNQDDQIQNAVKANYQKNIKASQNNDDQQF